MRSAASSHPRYRQAAKWMLVRIRHARVEPALIAGRLEDLDRGLDLAATAACVATLGEISQVDRAEVARSRASGGGRGVLASAPAVSYSASRLVELPGLDERLAGLDEQRGSGAGRRRAARGAARAAGWRWPACRLARRRDARRREPLRGPDAQGHAVLIERRELRPVAMRLLEVLAQDLLAPPDHGPRSAASAHPPTPRTARGAPRAVRLSRLAYAASRMRMWWKR